MGIGWLWIYTHSDNPEMLAKANERRAFAIYSRWRAILQCTGDFYAAICAYYHRLGARRTLLALSDHLLRDIGMYRTGSDVRVEEQHRLARWKKADATRARNANKNINHDQSRSAEIIEIDSIQNKRKATACELKLKAQH